MPRSSSLHGSAPDKHSVALLVIDLISDFRFEDGEKLARAAKRIVKAVAHLTLRVRASGVPVIYLNDNRGRWRSDRAELLKRCTESSSLGADIVRQLAPQERDYFILKPKHSGFFATPLSALLEHLGTRTVVLTGMTTEQCILFTAIDAYVREYDLIVPSDAVAGIRLSRPALVHIKTILKAAAVPCSRVRFARRARARK
jgi:nicotinamidase-related amidase